MRPRTAACGCRFPTWKNSTIRSKSEPRSTSADGRLRGRRGELESMDWDEALSGFDRDARGRSIAERTRRAYGVDLGQFVGWARGAGLEPEAVRHRDVRRYGAGL